MGIFTPFSNLSSFSLTPGPWQPLIHFLSLWICLFWTFHVNRNTQYVFFCVTGFHLFTSNNIFQAHPYGSKNHTLILLSYQKLCIVYICHILLLLFIHSSVDGHLGYFSFLSIMNTTPINMRFPCGSADKESACTVETWV